MSLLRRLPTRSSLLVLSLALTLGPGLPDSRLGRAMPESAANRMAGFATAAFSPDGADSTTLTSSARVVADLDRDPASGPAGSFDLARPSADPSTGCVGGAQPIVFVHGHRDGVATRPGSEAAGSCRLAGPKRFHGTDGRSAATVPVPAITTTAVAPAAPAATRWTGAYNLYRKTAFVTQKDFTWCVAASVQMMVNLVRHRSDRTAATQQRMIRYAQASDHGPWGPGGGTDVTGWISALRHFGAGKYRALGARSASAALRLAATAMRQTGRPAGMLVMDGRHAWILHGFESSTDPRHDRKATITSVRVSGPLYPIQQKHGYDLRPNTELSVRALARYFTPSSVGALVGRYVVIVPVH